jgi:hypothetical protein
VPERGILASERIMTSGFGREDACPGAGAAVG